MEAVRHIQTVTNGELHLQLPEVFWGKEVEVIILATAQEAIPVANARKSLRGVLQHHAQPERFRLGTALAKLGRHVGLTDNDMAMIEQAQDKTPANPMKIE